MKYAPLPYPTYPFAMALLGPQKIKIGDFVSDIRFGWDTEDLIKVLEIGEKEWTGVVVCSAYPDTLGAKVYVCGAFENYKFRYCILN